MTQKFDFQISNRELQQLVANASDVSNKNHKQLNGDYLEPFLKKKTKLQKNKKQLYRKEIALFTATVNESNNVQCTDCNKQYHLFCINSTNSDENNIEDFKCDLCQLNKSFYLNIIFYFYENI